MENSSRRNFLSGGVGGVLAYGLSKAVDGTNKKESKEEPRDIVEYLNIKLKIKVTHEDIKNILSKLEKDINIPGMEPVEVLKGNNAEAYISLRKGRDGLLRLHVEVI
jgi:hypothetical protein